MKLLISTLLSISILIQSSEPVTLNFVDDRDESETPKTITLPGDMLQWSGTIKTMIQDLAAGTDRTLPIPNIQKTTFECLYDIHIKDKKSPRIFDTTKNAEKTKHRASEKLKKPEHITLNKCNLFIESEYLDISEQVMHALGHHAFNEFKMQQEPLTCAALTHISTIVNSTYLPHTLKNPFAVYLLDKLIVHNAAQDNTKTQECVLQKKFKIDCGDTTQNQKCVYLASFTDENLLMKQITENKRPTKKGQLIAVDFSHDTIDTHPAVNDLSLSCRMALSSNGTYCALVEKDMYQQILFFRTVLYNITNTLPKIKPIVEKSFRMSTRNYSENIVFDSVANVFRVIIDGHSHSKKIMAIITLDPQNPEKERISRLNIPQNFINGLGAHWSCINGNLVGVGRSSYTGPDNNRTYNQALLYNKKELHLCYLSKKGIWKYRADNKKHDAPFTVVQLGIKNARAVQKSFIPSFEKTIESALPTEQNRENTSFNTQTLTWNYTLEKNNKSYVCIKHVFSPTLIAALTFLHNTGLENENLLHDALALCHYYIDQSKNRESILQQSQASPEIKALYTPNIQSSAAYDSDESDSIV